tara:strand:- start:153 stop:299 length:147 start_codon:yes stop_codon:yes gene_type:complete
MKRKYKEALLMLFLMVLFVMLSGCIKDYNLNPWTTVMNQLIKGNYEME